MNRTGQHRGLVLLITFLVSGAALAWGQEPPADPPPAEEEDIQSRGIVGAPRQIPGTVQFAFRITGAGQLTVAIGQETFSCSSTCSRPLRAGTPIHVTAIKTNPVYGFKEWQGCTGRIAGAACQMTVPSNTLTAGVGALFTSPLLEDMPAQREQMCRQFPEFCETCRINPNTPQCQQRLYSPPPR